MSESPRPDDDKTVNPGQLPDEKALEAQEDADLDSEAELDEEIEGEETKDDDEEQE